MDDALQMISLFQGTLYGKGIPFVILGILSALAALLMFALPETLNASLPTTMEEAEEYGNFRKESVRRRTIRASMKAVQSSANGTR